MKRLVVRIGIAVLVILVALASLKVYYIRYGADGTLLWNASEAYLFINVGNLGYMLSYLEYPVEAVKEYFGDVGLPQNRRFAVVVLHISPESIQRWEVQDTSLDFYTPIDGVIYANKQGTLWKWSGTQFEPASQPEQERLEGIKRLSARPLNGAEGWFKQNSILSRSEEQAEFAMELGGKPVKLMITRGYKSGSIVVDLVAPGIGSQRIWSLVQQPRRVSKSEYELAFNAH